MIKTKFLLPIIVTIYSLSLKAQGQESAASAKDIFSNEAGIEKWIKQKKNSRIRYMINRGLPIEAGKDLW